jgi:hypothetical protein
MMDKIFKTIVGVSVLLVAVSLTAQAGVSIAVLMFISNLQ